MPLIRSILAATGNTPEGKTSLIIADPKNELAPFMAEALAAVGRADDLIVLKPDVGWYNPLGNPFLANENEMVEKIVSFAENTNRQAGSPPRDHAYWENAQRNLLGAVVAATRTLHGPRLSFDLLNRTFRTIDRFKTASEASGWILEKNLPATAANAIRDFLKLPADSTRPCVASCVSNCLYFWTHQPLAQPLKPRTPRPYADDDRVVCHDESLRAFSSGKLNRPEQKEGWERICSQQEARFVLQLQTGRKNHAVAKHYFECLSRQQAGLDQELAYRLAHGSYKALSWSRDLALKWLALLAHYVADVEREYLPIAGTPGPAIDFVHHDTPVEGTYAAFLLILSKVKPTVEHAINELVTTRFDQQDGDALLALSLKLYGMAKFLEQVGKAQIELMDAWLDPTAVNRPGDRNVPRGENRNAGIYRDFYDLTFIVNSPEPLASILRGFHAGTTYVEERRYLPSFAEFRRLCRTENLPSEKQDNA